MTGTTAFRTDPVPLTRPYGERFPRYRDEVEWKTDRIGTALRGENPTVLRRMDAGFANIGDVQFLPGYCVLLVDKPDVQRLTDLPRPQRLQFLADMELLGEAVERVCARRDPAFRRVNLEILGNTDPYLHAHVRARYDWEPEHLVGRPVWLYPAEHWSAPETALGPQHDKLRAELTAEIDRLRS
ncbi:DeoR family transcriptional regulator [Allokutzneria multivorans]|uniref:DeoR family transcriptional regulator n=1 Tax=Allokutzneria multivorans TaxID=1142134 RepID=A0ABP7SKW5_9PSEU